MGSDENITSSAEVTEKAIKVRSYCYQVNNLSIC